MANEPNKTVALDADVIAYIETIDDEQKRADARVLLEVMSEVTGMTPKLWTGNMIGFGRYTYRYATGRTGEAFVTGFAPRKDNMTVYMMGIYDERPDMMERLGKYRLGKSCLYIKRLSDIDMDVLRELVAASIVSLKASSVVTSVSEQ